MSTATIGVMQIQTDVMGETLRGYLAEPFDRTSNYGVVLCHGLPVDTHELSSEDLCQVGLADRVALQVGMHVLALNMRGTGNSEKDFSLGGWTEDVKVGVRYLKSEHNVENVLLVGFGLGASIALYIAGSEKQDSSNGVCGVASFAARAHFDDWYAHSDEMLSNFRRMGLIRNADFPEDPHAWKEELRTTRVIDVMGNIPPRPLLLVHGSTDESVSVMEVHDLASAAGGKADVREIQGAGHRLQYDPRVIALLLGWLDDQRESEN